jgi:hypothetical protein
MDVSFVQVGLAIVSVFFVLVGYTVIYENPLQSSSELNSVANQIESMISHTDAYWLEQQDSLLFPSCSSPLIAEISSEFIRVKSLDSSPFQIVLSVPQILWISSDNSTFSSSVDFHQELAEEFGPAGTREDPFSNEMNITKWFYFLFNKTQYQFYNHPFIWSRGEYVTLEKCIIFGTSSDLKGSEIIPYIEFLIISKI